MLPEVYNWDLARRSGGCIYSQDEGEDHKHNAYVEIPHSEKEVNFSGSGSGKISQGSAMTTKMEEGKDKCEYTVRK